MESTGEILQNGQVFVINEQGTISFFPKGLGPDQTPVAVRDSRASVPMIRTNHLLPLTMFFRGNQRSLSPVDLKKLTDTGQMHTIDGNPCVLYRDSTSPLWENHYFFDPKFGMICRRIVRFKESKTFSQTDIRYQQYNDLGILPSSWKYSEFNPKGQPNDLIDTQNIEYAKNPNATSERFTIHFPENTRIHDESSQEKKTDVEPPKFSGWRIILFVILGLACSLVLWRMRHSKR